MTARRWVLLVLLLVATLALTLPGQAASADEAATSTEADEAATSTEADAATGAGATDEAPAATVHTVVANVGNAAGACSQSAYKLCLQAVEDRVAASLRALDPDVVALTEVLPPYWCDRTLTLNPFHVCASDQTTPQAARLLAHDDYDIVCADRFVWDCLAVRSSIGRIDACPEGGYCGGAVPPLPKVPGCEAGFESFLADVELRGVPLTVGVAHLDARDPDCRAADLAALFEAAPADGEVMLAGDFNLDPYRMDDVSVDVWHAHVGEGARFGQRSGITEHDPPYGTVYPRDSAQNDLTGLFPSHQSHPEAQGRTLDHLVATDGLPGSCRTLGKAPDTRRIDGPEGGLDHLALDCRVSLEPMPADGPTAPARTPAGTPPSAEPEPGESEVERTDGAAEADEPGGAPSEPEPAPPSQRPDLLRQLLDTLDRLLEALPLTA